MWTECHHWCPSFERNEWTSIFFGLLECITLGHVHFLGLDWARWVQTDMTRHTGVIDVTKSVAGMTDVIARARDYEPGAFVAYNGQIVPY